MQKPYIVCHMMASLDGRIDCSMTEKIPGVNEYYSTLNALNAPTTVSGRVTAEMEFGVLGRYTAKDATPVGKTVFSKKQTATAYECVVDTRGTLMWPEQAESEKPLLIITSEQAPAEYLRYLTAQNISYIAVGASAIDLAAAMDILAREFAVERVAVVGGGRINAGFLAAGLLDEVSVLLSPAIDGRAGEPALFDGLDTTTEPHQLKLTSTKVFDDGAIHLRYAVK